MNEPYARMENVTRTYERNQSKINALTSVSCSVVAGDRIAVMGRSGSGKSSLLHLFGGLDVPTRGLVTWPSLGHRSELRPAKVGLIFQMPSLIAPLTVVENVEIPLLLQKYDALDARYQAMGLLERINMMALADKLPEELSGGQQQRVAVARALASRPKLLLADEPTGQLDATTAQHLMDVMLEALDGTDTALVLATHDPTIAARLNVTWVIKDGVLEVNP